MHIFVVPLRPIGANFEGVNHVTIDFLCHASSLPRYFVSIFMNFDIMRIL